MKELNIGLFGFGCVGQGLHKVLSESKGIKANIKKICIKDFNKKRSIDNSLFTDDKDMLLNDPDINVIVELINDPFDAFDIVKKAITSGKAVVTANKKMLLDNIEEIIWLQNEYKIPFLYEGACCASIPIIRNLEEYYDNDLLTSVGGIFNGSTNYILSKQQNEDINFEDALTEAQKNGFAELDPSLDISGADAKYKLALVILHSFGVLINPENILTYGIDQLSEFDIKYAKEKNSKIRFLASCTRNGDTIQANCMSAFVSEGDVLFNTENEYNAVILESAFSEQQLMIGKGAGDTPTGSAVLSDISALAYDYKYEYKKVKQNGNLYQDDNFLMKIYVSFGNDLRPDISSFESIEEQYYGEERCYIIGKIRQKDLKESSWSRYDGLSIIRY